jgi:hypothetical protein
MTKDDQTHPQRDQSPKKPYKKPAFRHERVFETRALSCGKVQTTQQACAHNRKNS